MFQASGLKFNQKWKCVKVFSCEFWKFFRAIFFIETSGGFFQRRKDVNFFGKKISMVIAGLGSKYASAYDTSFYWKDFLGRRFFITTNTTLNSTFYKIFTWIYFFRQVIKTDNTFSCIIQKPDINTLTSVSNLSKK